MIAAGEDQATPGPAPREGRSPTQIALERLRKDKFAMASVAVIVLFILVGVFAPVLTSLVGVNDQADNSTLDFNGLPLFQYSSAHPFGVESGTGYDLFYKWAYGARPSLIIGIVAAALTVLVGAALGLISGFLGGWVDRVINWFVDFILSLPFILMVIALVPILINRFGNPDSLGFVPPEKQANIRFGAIIFVLVLFSWPTVARLVRGEVLSLREREFVQAARSLGMPTSRIIRKELLPNLLGPILVNLSVLIPAFISVEAALSYLGVGLQPPINSWGQTISAGSAQFDTYPLWMWVPAISVSLLVLALSLFGDAVSDAFNPQTRR
ncbi:peptide ABC transporter permease [Luteipulveratus mongoliensis]|uniref:Peptide ABC transporter permease n=1 Tax=Luteipulveratus mongoliensis TaxID=571913 RepID=A0A0K1JQQ3_9MICO|nr:peptide ABC transporter permease [Luteipulveratus mongoliensis]